MIGAIPAIDEADEATHARFPSIIVDVQLSDETRRRGYFLDYCVEGDS